jgi:hypothetical protein
MTNGGIGMNSLGVAWELGPGGPVKETPDIPSAVRSRTHVQQSDKSRLVLLRDFHPIGDRDWHTEMPDEP